MARGVELAAIRHSASKRRHRSGGRDHLRTPRPRRPDLLDRARIHHHRRCHGQRRLPFPDVRRPTAWHVSLGSDLLRRRHEHTRRADRLWRQRGDRDRQPRPRWKPRSGPKRPNAAEASPQAQTQTQATRTAATSARHRVISAAWRRGQRAAAGKSRSACTCPQRSAREGQRGPCASSWSTPSSATSHRSSRSAPQVRSATTGHRIECDTSNGDEFSEVARRTLGEVQAASALC
jgi:hypothetical protein